MFIVSMVVYMGVKPRILVQFDSSNKIVHSNIKKNANDLIISLFWKRSILAGFPKTNRTNKLIFAFL